MTDAERHEQHTSRDWRERAACRAGVDPDLFFPAAESGAARDAQVRAAKAVCARCPVRARVPGRGAGPDPVRHRAAG